jgi:ribosomal protein S18 acetylase RimI-like enzyme
MQQVLYDGWVIRLADGYTRRANSVSPIYTGHTDPEEKITVCEGLYRERGLRPVFKMTPLNHPTQLDAILARRSYMPEAITLVKSLNLYRVVIPETGSVEVWTRPEKAWFDTYVKLKGLSEYEIGAFRNILDNLAVAARFVMLMDDDEPVAGGFTIREGELAGLFGLVTDTEKRNRGFGRLLTWTLLDRARKAGAKTAYLQVEEDNEAARHVYESIGFREIYRYWYRTLES